MEKALAAWLLVAASITPIARPTEVVRGSVEELVEVVQDSDLARPCASERRHFEIRRIAEHLFDFREMARRSLGRHWTERSTEEREEFVRLFAELVERSYFGQLEHYSGERIVYTGETLSGEFATVRSKIITGRKSAIPLDYRVRRVGSRWAVYDIRIEGVSLVSSYRSQFNKIIRTSSYDDLIQKLEPKEPQRSTLHRSALKSC